MMMYDFVAKVRNIQNGSSTSNVHILKMINITIEMF